MSKSILYSLIGALCALLCNVAMGQDPPVQQVTIDIDEPALHKALIQFTKQTGFQLIFPEGDKVAGLPAPRVSGTFTPQAALDLILKNSGLHYEFLTPQAIAIYVSKQPSPVSAAPAQVAPVDEIRLEMRLAQSESMKEAENTDSPDNKKPDSSGEAFGSKIQEVVVTARKREERLQDVPMSVGVLSGENLEARGFYAQQDYLRAVPGVSEINRGAWNNNIVIRGISIQPQQQGSPGSPGNTVATYFGETPITAAGGMGGGGVDIRPVDVDRVEVLRGPQGTTFGAASISGAVRILPRAPDVEDFSGRLNATVSETSGSGSVNDNYQAVVNIPIIENAFAIRAVAYSYFDSGYYRNVIGNTPSAITFADTYGVSGVPDFRQSENGELTTKGARLSALWQASSQFSVTASYLTQTIEQNGSPSQDFGGRFDQVRLPVPASHRVNEQPGEAAEGEIEIFNVTGSYDLGFGQLTATGSYLDAWSSTVVSGFDLASVPLVFYYQSPFKSKSGEIRFSSSWESPLQLLAGVFHQKIDEAVAAGAIWPGTPATNVFSPNNPDNRLAVIDGWRLNSETGVFGELGYHITERLTAAVGARHWIYDRSSGGSGGGPLFGDVPIGEPEPILGIKDSGQTYKGSLDYKFTRDAMAYVTWSQGFRLGNKQGPPDPTCDVNPRDGLIDGTNVTTESTERISSDSLDQYEVGGKFSFLNGRLYVDASAYYIDWQDLPVRTSVPLPQGGACFYVANAGSAESKGFDLQTSWRATDQLTLSLGFGYNKANLTEAVPVQNWPDGARLPGSPEINANVSSQYTFKLSGHDAFVRADATQVGSFYGDLLESPNLRAGDYIELNARVGIAVGGARIEAFARNLTDANNFTYRNYFASDRPEGYRLRPRTVGIQLMYDWGK